MRFGLAAALILGASCASKHAVTAKSYARNCATVADCVAVYEGPIGCCGGGCPNAAIRADALADYTSDVFAAAPTCNPPPPCAAPLPCDTGRVACVAAVCTLEAPAPDANATD